LPYLPPCRQTSGITRGFDENFSPRCGSLDSTSNKGGDNLMEKASEGKEFRRTILPRGGGIILLIWPNPFLCPRGDRWGKTLIGA